MGRGRSRRRRADRGRHAAATGFLGTRHTRRWLRGNRASEDLSWRGGAEEWIAAGSPDTLELARERVRQALAHEPVGLPADVEAELCRLVDEAAARLGLSGHPDPRRLLDEARTWSGPGL